MGYREFKQKLNSGMLWEGSRAVSVGKHEVLLKEDATVIRQRMDALFKSLVSMLKTALLKSKGRFDEEELRAVFAEHGMDVPSAKRFIGSLLESRTEEGRSVSYISSVKKKDSNELSFTVTKGFDLLLSRYQKLFAQRIAGNRGDRLLFYCTPFSDLNMLLNLLSMLDCLSFSVEEAVRLACMYGSITRNFCNSWRIPTNIIILYWTRTNVSSRSRLSCSPFSSVRIL